MEEEEEEGLFKADAVNEEDPERDRATQLASPYSYLGLFYAKETYSGCKRALTVVAKET